MPHPISLFAHGGPGLNSFAEKALLGPIAEKAGIPIEFWNEPSKLRPDGWAFDPDQPYSNWVKCLEASVARLADRHGPINLIAHSFAAGPALEIARSRPALLRCLTLIAGAFDYKAAAKRIMGVAASDFWKAGLIEKAKRVEQAAAETRVLGDQAMLEGLLLALEDAALFEHYYFDQKTLESVFSILSAAGACAQMDVDSFAGIFKNLNQIGAQCFAGSPINLPVLYLVGDSEEITDIQAELPLHKSYLKKIKFVEVARSSHFLHLDQPHVFLEELSEFLADLPR